LCNPAEKKINLFYNKSVFPYCRKIKFRAKNQDSKSLYRTNENQADNPNKALTYFVVTAVKTSFKAHPHLQITEKKGAILWMLPVASFFLSACCALQT